MFLTLNHICPNTRFISCSIILSMSCLLYALQHLFDFFVFHLCLIFLFILHPSCIIFYPCSYLLFFPSFLLIHLSICDKKGQSILKCIIISIRLMFTFLGGEILPYAPSQGEKVLGEKHIPRGRRYTFMRKPCFVLFYLMLFFSLLCGALSYIQYLCFVALIALCLCVGHAYILMSLCFIGCMFR